MNIVIVKGRLSRDPEVKTSKNGNVFSTGAIAVNREGKDRNMCDFINYVAFGHLAEIMDKYLQKGSEVVLIGRWQVDKRTGTDGKDRYESKLIVDRMEFCGSRETVKEPTLAKTDLGDISDLVGMGGSLDGSELPFK